MTKYNNLILNNNLDKYQLLKLVTTFSDDIFFIQVPIKNRPDPLSMESEGCCSLSQPLAGVLSYIVLTSNLWMHYVFIYLLRTAILTPARGYSLSLTWISTNCAWSTVGRNSCGWKLTPGNLKLCFTVIINYMTYSPKVSNLFVII